MRARSFSYDRHKYIAVAFPVAMNVMLKSLKTTNTVNPAWMAQPHDR